jgi:hypothetical protein
MNPTLTALFSYSFMFAVMLLPQIEETRSQYMKRLKILVLFLLPSMLSIITINCLESSCYQLAQINSLIVMVWCVSTALIFLFKKLI